MRKIIIHSNTLWSICNFRFDLISTLLGSGYKVYSLAPKDNISSSSESRLKSLNTEVVDIEIDRKGTNPINDLKYLYRLIKTFKQIKPDAVLLYTPKPNIYGSLACRILNIPYINTINGLGSGFLKGFPISTIIRQLYKLALRKSQWVYVQNHDDLHFFQKTRIVSNKYCSFIPGSGIDTRTYQISTKREPVSGAYKFLYAGRLIKEKGVFDFVDVARQLKPKYPEVEFWMVGFIDEGNPSSISSKELEDLANSGLVDYKGKTDQIIEFLNVSDVMVFPTTYREGLPRILLEAASCSMPIITYDVPGCRELVKDNYNGILCEKGNKEQLLSACEKVINSSPLELARMGENGRKRVVSEFSIEIVNEYYVSTLAKIMNSKNS